MKRLNDSSDGPEVRLGTLLKNIQAQRRRQGCILLSRGGMGTPGCVNRRAEFVVDSGASMHVVSKKDLSSAELETMRTSRSPTTVMTANGEVQSREEATENVKQLDFFVTVMLLEKCTGSSFTWEALRRIWVQSPLDDWPETTSYQERQEKSFRHIKT